MSVRVGLFVTCLVDLVRPQVGFAAVKLLEQAGCTVEVPDVQTCCGQPAWNAGADRDARDIARQVIATFEGFDYVVAPSGSCAGMIKRHYPELLKDDAEWKTRAEALAAKTYELLSFLAARGFTANVTCNAMAAYHDSCSSMREMNVREQPRGLLASVNGLTLLELKEKDVCCGFGGLFSLKYPEISARMADDKLADAKSSGAQLIVGGDLGCLLHLAGRLSREGSPLRCRHVAEILAGFGDSPAIGEDA